MLQVANDQRKVWTSTPRQLMKILYSFRELCLSSTIMPNLSACIWWAKSFICEHGPLTRHADCWLLMHRKSVTHVTWCMSGSLARREKRSRNSWRMSTRNFTVFFVFFFNLNSISPGSSHPSIQRGVRPRTGDLPTTAPSLKLFPTLRIW